MDFSSERPSLSQVWSKGYRRAGRRFCRKCSRGGRPSSFIQALEDRAQSRASYFFESRMSSMARMTTASTPGSPTHCGVVSLGKSRFG